MVWPPASGTARRTEGKEASPSIEVIAVDRHAGADCASPVFHGASALVGRGGAKLDGGVAEVHEDLVQQGCASAGQRQPSLEQAQGGSERRAGILCADGPRDELQQAHERGAQEDPMPCRAEHEEQV